MNLTSTAVEKASPKEKSHKLSDGDGLYLLVETHGAKLWRFRYVFSGKEKMLSLGKFPAVGLAAARRKRDDARKLLGGTVRTRRMKGG